MKKEGMVIVLLWIIVSLISALAIIYGLRLAIESTVKLAVSVIGAAAVLLGGILTHALTQLREQRLEQQRAKQKKL